MPRREQTQRLQVDMEPQTGGVQEGVAKCRLVDAFHSKVGRTEIPQSVLLIMSLPVEYR